jgi:hypothetical protein
MHPQSHPLLGLLCAHAGVVEAIRKKYLKKLYFGFSSDQDARQLLEEVGFAIMRYHPHAHWLPWLRFSPAAARTPPYQ